MRSSHNKAAILSGTAAIALVLSFLIPCFGGFCPGFVSADTFSDSGIISSVLKSPHLIASFLTAIGFLSFIVFLAVIDAPFRYSIISLIPFTLLLFFAFGVIAAIIFFLLAVFLLFILTRRIRRDMANRIDFQLASLIRLPLSGFFLFVFLVGAFAAAPLSERFMLGVMRIIIEPSAIRALPDGETSAEMTVQNFIDSETAKRSKICLDNEACEAEMQALVAEEVKKQMFTPQMLAITPESELLQKPMADIAVSAVSEKMLNSEHLPPAFRGDVAPKLLWSFLLFLLLAPFSLILSAIATFFTSLLFQLLLAAGAFRRDKQTVKRDVIS